MNRFLRLLLPLPLLFHGAFCRAKEAPAYGSNPEAGKTVDVNGIKMYYETYGEGPPLLLIHPNSGSLSNMSPQIEEFSKSYRVIAADSRGHGRSGAGEGRLTYPQMAEDLDKLLESLDVKSAHVVGWSDGGILGLLLAIHHPDKVGKLAIMGANLTPDGSYPWAQEWVTKQVKAANAEIAGGNGSPELQMQLKYFDLLGKQPDIPVDDLKKIKSPVLVMAGDRDVIRTEHTVLIFESIPNSQLEIFPGATHMISREDPERFNRTVASFLKLPFKRPDTKTMFR